MSRQGEAEGGERGFWGGWGREREKDIHVVSRSHSVEIDSLAFIFFF